MSHSQAAHPATLLRRLLRAQLRLKVMAGVVVVTLLALVAFDVGAVATMRRYLLTQTDSNLQGALTLTLPRLAAALAFTSQTAQASNHGGPGQVVLPPPCQDALAPRRFRHDLPAAPRQAGEPAGRRQQPGRRRGLVPLAHRRQGRGQAGPAHADRRQREQPDPGPVGARHRGLPPRRLAIAAEIAAAHGGTAEAAPAFPHGLRVLLTLPASPPSTSHTARDLAAAVS